MLINWFTVVAQIVNFLILVWLLKRFLYKPILKAVDDREKQIASRIESAEKKEAEALQERKDYQEKNEALEHNRKNLLDTAASEASSQRQLLLESARKEASELQQKLQQELAANKERLGNSIGEKIQNETIALTAKILMDLATVDLEEQAVTQFIQQVERISTTHSEITSAIRQLGPTLTIRTAFELNSTQKEAITKALCNYLEPSATATFNTDPQLILGIELAAGGYSIGWNAAAYLASVKKQLKTFIEPGAETPPK